MEITSDSNMNEYIPPRPCSRRPSFRKFAPEKMVRFTFTPTIQELEKKMAPPGSTPCGSLTDFSWEEGSSMNSVVCPGPNDNEIVPSNDQNNNTRNNEEAQQTKQGSTTITHSSSEVLKTEERVDGDNYAPPNEPRITTYIRKSVAPPKTNVIQADSHSTISSTHATVYSSMESFPQPEKVMGPTVKRRCAPQGYNRVFQRHARRKQSQPSLESLTARPPTGSSTELEFPASEYCNFASRHERFTKSAYSSRRYPERVLPTAAVSVKSNQFPGLESVLHELKQKRMVFDRSTAIHALKGRIIRGEKVTYDEIFAIKSLNIPVHQKHMGWRLPWSMDLYCVKGLVHIPTPNKPVSPNSFGTVEDLRIPLEDAVKEEHFGRRRYIINLGGFRDNEIGLYLEGKNKLVIRAVRENHQASEEGVPPTIATETILLPPDLSADNLRIVRTTSGTTIIEECWRF